MDLLRLQKIASKGYADGDGLGNYFNKKTGQPTRWHTGDTLEWFVAIEIAETFDEKASPADQLKAAREAMESAHRDLQGAIDALFKEEMRLEKEGVTA